MVNHSSHDLASSGIHYRDLAKLDLDKRGSLLFAFYNQVFKPAFPKVDQTEDPSVWLPLIDENAVPAGQPVIHVILALDSSEDIAGGLIFEHYRISDCWLATYLAVRADMRNRGIAGGLVGEALREIRLFGSECWVLFAEAEDPDRISAKDEQTAAELRLRILDGLGFQPLLLQYVQPSLGPGKRQLDDLRLLCRLPQPDCTQVPAARIASFLREFYAALDQSDSPWLAATVSELRGAAFVQRKRV
jgi:GNAT superfamily N-acetyltransferase